MTGSAAPDAFGRFRVLHQIGAGTLGPVFRGFDPETDRLVAIKLFRLDLPPERVHQLVADFERLIDAQLAHPAIAAPLATGIAGNDPYLAAEFAAADSLDIIVRDHGPAPLENAIALAAQLAGAIDFAAVVHVGHGSLHPRDVLVSPDDTRVTGFGIAQALERVGVAAPVRRPYTAPERVDHHAWTREADVFSVAAICYELLMGRRIAGAGADAADGLTEVPGLDLAQARAVFARALAVDPAQRFPNALDFVDALRQSMSAGKSAVAPASSTVESRDPRRSIGRIEQEPRLPLDEPARTARLESVVVKTESAVAKTDSPAAGDIDVPLAAPIPPPASTFAPSDLELRAAESDRYQDVESAPAVPVPAASPGERFRDASSTPAPVLDEFSAEPVEPVPLPRSRPEPAVEPSDHVSVLDRSRSALWPLALALLVGLALGFAAGYGIGTRGSASPPAGVAAGRDYTESSVPPESTAQPSSQPPASERSTTTSPASGSAENANAATSGSNPAGTGSPAKAVPPPSAPPRATAVVPAPRTKPAPPAEDESPRLLIRSTPDGARVFVDGRDRGVTPLVLRDLPRGGHRVRLEREGYVTEERHVFLSARRPSESLQISLMRPAPRESATSPAGMFVGTLSVESLPTGAKVFVDNRLAGTTPLTLPNVAAGSHAVRLEHDGYRRWSSSVRVVAGERNRVTASLEK